MGKSVIYQKCLKQLEEELQKHNEKSPFLAIDVGTFRSRSFNPNTLNYRTSLNASRVFVEKLFSDRKWTFDDWEKSFMTIPGVMNMQSYIASLQKTIASKANCLFLMGGGSFQKLALQYYLELHPRPDERCIKYICVGHFLLTHMYKWKNHHKKLAIAIASYQFYVYIPLLSRR